MANIISGTGVTHIAQQVSGVNEQKKNILAVLVKKTYRIDDNGICVDDIPTLPLVDEFKYYEDKEGQLLEHDIDLYHVKLQTDVVVKGFAQNNGKSKQFTSEVMIGTHHTSILAIGNRKAFLNQNGTVTFSEPEFINKIPLRYDYAYGGWDKIGEYKIEDHSEERIKIIEKAVDWQKGSPYYYPRNPHGKGYLVDLNAEAVEQLELPNLEDLTDRLLPTRLAAGNKNRWVEMPIPRCTDWINLNCFPRYDLFGFPGVKSKPNSKVITEVSRGWLPNDILVERPPKSKLNFKCMNGASLGLQLPFLRGNEICRLINIHPDKSNFNFKLPGQTPQIWVDGRQGTLKPTTTVLHTVLIEPEENRVSLVWRGSADALRPYLDHELPNMPFKVTW